LKEGVSIIICFYNAGERLINTLTHICKQNNRNKNNTELILVNNCSNDNSLYVINEVLKGFELFSWKTVSEIQPGLANARICGLRHAQFDLLLYCDDDNWLNPNYVEQSEKIMRNNPLIAILGGKGEAVSNIPIPAWFESVQNHYAVGPQSDQNGRVKGKRNMVYGAGMVMRKTVFEELLDNGFEFLSLGRTGSNLSAGEDSEMCLATQIMGKYIWYESSLTFMHYMESSRLDFSYLKRMKNGKINSSFYSRFYRDYLFGYTPKITKYFWHKELIYAFIEMTTLFITMNSKFNRQIQFIRFLLKERENYSQHVNSIILTCHNLKNASNEIK
jgi:glycosyltransferase involved in cell wall biosynthesis